jgi:hypothetical protein
VGVSQNPIIWYFGHRYYIMGCRYDEYINRHYHCFGVVLRPLLGGRDLIRPANQLDEVVEKQAEHIGMFEEPQQESQSSPS